MRSNTLTLTLATADDDGISASQNPSANADLLINGALTSGGVATLDVARRVIITSAADDSAVTFTVYGTNRDGIAMQEAITGAAIGVAQSTKNFKTVTRIATSGNAGSLTVGTNGVASTAWVPQDHRVSPFHLSLVVLLSSGASLTYQVEHTLDDIQDINNIKDAGVIRTLTHETLVGKTTSDDGNYFFPVRATRLTFTSFTSGTASFITQQSG